MSGKRSFVEVQVLYDFRDRCKAELEAGRSTAGDGAPWGGVIILLTRLTDLIVDHELTAAEVMAMVADDRRDLELSQS